VALGDMDGVNVGKINVKGEKDNLRVLQGPYRNT